MPAVLIPLVDGFEEIEAITTIDLLRRAGVEVTTAGIGKKRATGSHDITVETDAVFDDVAEEFYDAIVLPGGPGTGSLNEVRGLHELLREYHERGKILGAICAAPTVLAAAGLLKGKRAACFPSVENKMAGAEILHEPVVVDGTIITSRGAGTAVPFALALVAKLCSQEDADEIARKIVYADAAPALN